MAKVSIGLLVYNEAPYIKQTLDSIQSQSFDDYEILIGDNASTDGTTEILREAAARDGRIKHIRHSRNIGAIQNWNELVRQASGEYFVLAGGHDLWSADYLRDLTHALDGNLDAVVAFSKTQWLDSDGREINIKTSLLDTSGLSTVGRFVSLMFANQHYLYGMMRLSAMKHTRLQLEIVGSGEIFLQELAQVGDFIFVEGPRWYRRQNRDRERLMERLRRYQGMLFSSTWMRRRFRVFPFMQMMSVYLLLPFRIRNISLRRRLCLAAVYPLIIFKYTGLIMCDLKWLFRN